MRNPLLLLVIMLCFLTSCKEEIPEKPWIITKVNERAERIAVLMEGTPSSLGLKIKGSVDGQFRVLLAGGNRNGNSVYNFQGGAIDTLITRPWTSNTCKTIYNPERATSGSLEIEVKLLK